MCKTVVEVDIGSVVPFADYKDTRLVLRSRFHAVGQLIHAGSTRQGPEGAVAVRLLVFPSGSMFSLRV